LREAEEDLTTVLQSPDAPTFVCFRRATVRERLKNHAGASEDRAEGLRREPADEISWVTRGLQRVKSDPKAALADFRKAEELNPRSFFALQNQAHVLSEYLKQDREALAVLDRLITLFPQSQQARAGRAVLLARAGRVDEALTEVETCLKDNPLPMTRYQLAGVFALTLDRSGHADVALHLLYEALADGAGWVELPADPDLRPLHGNKQFQQLLAAAIAIKAAKHARPR
jgi:eukaryotic-like serine/threonine-protein kinase